MEVLDTHRSRLHFGRRARAEYTIMLVKEGAERFVHRGRSFVAPKGSLILINPDEAYPGEARQGTRSYAAIYPSVGLLREFLPQPPSGLLVFPQVVVEDAVAASKFSELLESVFSAHTPLGLHCKFAELMSAVSIPRSSAPIDRKCGRDVSNAVRVVRERIESAPAQAVTLTQLAGKAGMEPLALLRAFQRVVGCTPHIFQVSQRLRLAKKALRAGDTIVDAALACGFVDQSHFTNTFRRWTGITPAHYVRSIRSA